MSDYKYLQASDGTGNAVLANITTNRAIGSTVLQVDSVDKWPSEFIFTTGVLLPNNYIDPATVTEMTGHLESGDIIIDGFEPGHSDTGNTTDQVAIIKQTTGWADRAVELARVSHNDDGTPKEGSIGLPELANDGAKTVSKIADGVTNAANTEYRDYSEEITLEAGTWLIYSQLRFNCSVASERAGFVRIFNASDGVSVGESGRMHIPASTSDNDRSLTTSCIVTLTSPKSFKHQGRLTATSGSNIISHHQFFAIRLAG